MLMPGSEEYCSEPEQPQLHQLPETRFHGIAVGGREAT